MSDTGLELSVRDRLTAVLAASHLTDMPYALAKFMEELVSTLRSEAFQTGYETAMSLQDLPAHPFLPWPHDPARCCIVVGPDPLNDRCGKGPHQHAPIGGGA